MKSASQTTHEVIELLDPIISDTDAAYLVKHGWVGSVLDLEKKWAQFIAENAGNLESVQEVESLPRAKYLRQSATLLISDPSAYAATERGLEGNDKWEKEKGNFAKNSI